MRKLSNQFKSFSKEFKKKNFLKGFEKLSNWFEILRHSQTVLRLFSLCVPAPLLKTGENTIQVFELHIPGDQLHFVDQPVLG